VTEDEQIWRRREGESNPAYEAFRSYMRLRSTTKVAEDLGKSITLVTGWCTRNEWVERIAAYDSYVVTADTDGLVHALAESRDKNLALMDKLRGLLDMRLDDFIAKRMDPTNNWSKAVEVMARVEQNSLLMGQKTMEKQSESVTKVETLVRRLEELNANG